MMFTITERILLTLWIGGMWTVGYVVAPTLFSMLDDRALAGSIAGQLFTIMSYIGIFCATFLIISQLAQAGKLSISQWQFWGLLVMLIILMIGQFVIQPIMAGMREAGLVGESAKNFGRLHGVSSVLFLINSLIGLGLVIFGLRRLESVASSG